MERKRIRMWRFDDGGGRKSSFSQRALVVFNYLFIILNCVYSLNGQKLQIQPAQQQQQQQKPLLYSDIVKTKSN
jgi:hypothetical protein